MVHTGDRDTLDFPEMADGRVDDVLSAFGAYLHLHGDVAWTAWTASGS